MNYHSLITKIKIMKSDYKFGSTTIADHKTSDAYSQLLRLARGVILEVGE